MKMLKNIAIISVFLLAFPTIGSTKEMNAWRDCGIGAIIFPEIPIGAIVSNIIWDLGTTALISAAASEEQCKGKEVVAARFIFEAYPNLEEETAKGGGQHIHAVLNILGCESTSHADIISSLRPDFDKSLRNPDYVYKSSLVKAQDYYNMVIVKVSGDFAEQCQST